MNRQSRALLTILIVFILIVPVLLLRRCGGNQVANRSPSSPATAEPVRGGTLMASARSELRTFNKMSSAQSAPTDLFVYLTQGKLFRINRTTMEPEPWLAEKWAASEDGLTQTITLRDGITWSDGVPLTSADVLFSFEAAYQTVGSVGGSLLVNGKPFAVTAPDARTVVITFPAPFAPGVRALDNLPIMPRHKLEAALRAGTFDKAWSASTPPSEIVGLGPFVLARYEPGQRLVYDRNPRYWRKDERGQPLPYLDRIVVEMVPEQDAEVVRLQAGQIDVMQQQLRATDITTFRTLEQQGKVRVFDLGVSLSPDHFIFNLRPAKWAKDPRGAWLATKEFRQAISHAVDREAFANTVYLGEAVPVHGPVTTGNAAWFSPNVPRYPYSLDRARALLEGLGLKNRDADEWLEDEKGVEARFTLQTFGGASILQRSAEVLRDDLKRVGIAVDVVPLEPPTVIQKVQAGEFDAVFVAFGFSDTDPAVSRDFWFSSGSTHFWNPSQKTPATDWEREIDALMTKQAVTADLAERKKLFNEVQRIFAENLPMIHFAAPRVYVAASPRVTHLTPGLMVPQILWNAEAVAVAPGSGQRPPS